MRDFLQLRDTFQRFAAHILPMACGFVATTLCAPIIVRSLPSAFRDDIVRLMADEGFSVLSFVLITLILLLLFFGGYLLGWFVTSWFVPWNIAEEHLKGEDGKLTALHARIAAFFGRGKDGGA
jgi:hypothetical protein